MIARILATGLMSAAMATAQATGASPEIPAVQVQYADLDLGTEYGAETLYKRIQSAAKQVCPWEDQRNLRAWRASQRCISDAIARAVADVNNPQLAKVDAKHNPRVTEG